jgi:hypothetical protein
MAFSRHDRLWASRFPPPRWSLSPWSECATSDYGEVEEEDAMTGKTITRLLPDGAPGGGMKPLNYISSMAIGG